MGVLSIIENAVFYLLLIPVILKMGDALMLTLRLVHLRLNMLKEQQRWSQGIIELDDLYHLTPREFEYWCGEIIEKLGYSNIEHSKSSVDSGKDIECRKNLLPVYVECKRFYYSQNAEYAVTSEVCKKLVGAMVHDGITKGMIITTGIITRDAVDYIRTLPQMYDITLLSGKDLIEQYSQVQNLELQTV